MPDWRPDPHEECDARRWPLRLLTAPGYFQSHTAFAGVRYLRRREGPPCVILHPDEAAARGLADGDQVHLRNDRGAAFAADLRAVYDFTKDRPTRHGRREGCAMSETLHSAASDAGTAPRASARR